MFISCISHDADSCAQFVDGHVTGVNTYELKYEYILKEELKSAWDAKQYKMRNQF